MPEIRRVGLVGTGIMGSGIVQTCAQAGYPTVMVGRSSESIARAMKAIESGLGRQVERNQITPGSPSGGTEPYPDGLRCVCPPGLRRYY